jgi:hypothetical protein
MRICISNLLSISPGNPDYLIKQGSIYLNLGETDNFSSWAKRTLIQYPRSAKIYRFVADNQLSENKVSEAIHLMETGLRFGLEELSPELEKIKKLSPDQQNINVNQDYINDSFDSPNLDYQANGLMLLFAGRENCYARQWVQDDGQSGYTIVKEPISPNIVKNHLQGNITVGVYQLTNDNTVHWIVLDLDADKSVWDDMMDPQYRHWLEEGFSRCHTSLTTFLAPYNINVYREFSGRKGYHYWLFIDGALPAKIAKDFGQIIAAQIDVTGYPINIEVFPKQIALKKDQFGNLVKLPYGIHRVTGAKSYFLDSSHLPIDLPVFLQIVKKASPAEIVNALSCIHPEFLQSNHAENVLTDTANSEITSDIQSAIITNDFSLDSDMEWQWLVRNCFAIRDIAAAVDSIHQLNSDQKKVIIHTCGHLTQGAKIVNALLKRCSSSDQTDFLKSNLGGNPISCQKIKATLGYNDHDTECNCQFPNSGASYMYPLLHLKNINHITVQSPDLHKLQVRNLVERYLSIKKQINDLKSDFSKVESQLLAIFDEAGVLEIDTPWGMLHKTTDDQTVQLILKV